MPDKQLLKLSYAFMKPPRQGEFEWTATVLNINYEHNEKLLSNCKTLSEYAILIKTINEYKQKYDDIRDAMENAIDYCISHDILKDFLLEMKNEAMNTLLTEYDEQKTMEYLRQDAYDDGRNDGFAEGESSGLVKGEKRHLVSLVCKKMTKSKSVEQIADEPEEDIPLIQKIYDIATEFSPDYDVDKIMEKLEQQ